VKEHHSRAITRLQIMHPVSADDCFPAFNLIW